jgi:DNA-binding PadR family transcriptional regulator
LGLLWELGPSTAYAIRKEFLASPSPHWSGSAGAIYPLIRRLEGQGLIRSADGTTGRRRSKRYSLTPGGREALRRWLGPPLADRTLGVPPDPLRTRMRFLGALPPKRKMSFLTQAQRWLPAHLAQVEKESERYRRAGALHAHLMALGAVRVLRARLKWIREVVAELGDSSRRKTNKRRRS